MNVSDDPKLVRNARIAIVVLLACAVFALFAMQKLPLPGRIAIAAVNVIAAAILFVMIRRRPRE